ncbi:MAG: hypothetical protein ACOYOT_01740 [Bacteroidales bacterium]
MREYPLTNKQIEICNYVLSIKNQNINKDYLYYKGYDTNVDLNFALKYLLDNKLISVADPVCLTDIGTKYLKTGIVKFFKDQRRDAFLNSVTAKTILFVVPIIISIFGTIISYNQSKKIENHTIHNNNNINKYIDSVVQTKINEFKKTAIDIPSIDSIKHTK